MATNKPLDSLSGAADDPELVAAATRLKHFVDAHQPVLVIAGAGMSTASGIGDYRDAAGVYKRPPPVTITQFLATPAARQRYWARSMYGWPAFSQAQPNAAHRALAQLEQAGSIGGLVSQNVDGLHQRAGHQRLLELHGNLHRVLCLECGALHSRAGLQGWLERANSHLLGQQVPLAPDGDADLSVSALDTVAVPECERCGGLLKPDVVFFGDAVPGTVVQQAYDWLESCGALLIVGSSVMIHSSFRFCRRAQERDLPIAAVNIGRTRADDWLQLKLALPCETLLPLLCSS